MYEDYADLQFIERNATEHDRRRSPHHRTSTQHHSRSPYHSGYHAGSYENQMTHAQPHVSHAQHPSFGGNNLFGRMTTGQMIDMVAQIYAALMPLPSSPVATADAVTDVGNLILYQGSLASYAKRDEQVRTIGNLITKLVG